MEDKNLVNKPVDVDAIIKALRCASAPGDPIEDCKKCPFGETENLTPEQSEQLGTDELVSCDIDRVGMEAADRLANDQTHIAALKQEIEKLRSDRRWIPVTERLPVGDNQVLVVASGKPRENIELVHAVEIASLYDDGWCLETWPEWTGAVVTHWMPMPEAPEVECK